MSADAGSNPARSTNIKYIMVEDYDKKDYEQDFPAQGTFNWKRVLIANCEHSYYEGAQLIGVVLHDGNFMINGVMFEKHEFKIIDENPL